MRRLCGSVRLGPSWLLVLVGLQQTSSRGFLISHGSQQPTFETCNPTKHGLRFAAAASAIGVRWFCDWDITAMEGRAN